MPLCLRLSRDRLANPRALGIFEIPFLISAVKIYVATVHCARPSMMMKLNLLVTKSIFSFAKCSFPRLLKSDRKNDGREFCFGRYVRPSLYARLLDFFMT